MIERSPINWVYPIPRLALILIAVLAAASAWAQPHDLSARIDAIAQNALDDGPIAGLSIAVVQDGEMLHARGYGLADTGVGTPVTTETLFNAASVGKIIAAAAVLRLVDEGRLDLDDDLATLLPSFPNPEQGRQISLRQLLNHTAGLNDYVAASYDRWKETGQPLDPSFVLDYVRGRPLDFAPGTHWIYSNTGFYLAGLILERVTGRPWGAYVIEEIARPLGLDSVVLCDEAGTARSVGYDVTDDGFVPSVQDAERGVRGDAGLCATALDLARLTSALTTSGLLSDESLDVMLAPTVLANGIVVDYSLGVARGTLDGHALWGHVGGNSSSNVAALVHYPEADLSIAVLVNTRFGEVGALMIEAEVARLVLGLGKPTLANLPLDPKAQARYLGTYVGDRGDWRYHIVADDERLARVSAEDTTSVTPLLRQNGHAFGRADWPMDRFVFHFQDDRARAYSIYYNGLFGGLYRRIEPRATWDRAEAHDAGFDVERLAALTRDLREGRWGNIHALLISRNGQLVYEEYFEGLDERIGEGERHVVFAPSTLHDIRSISKTVTATLVGIALDQGLLPSVDTPLAELLPDYRHLLTGPKATLTLRHVLTMSTGLAWDEDSLPYTDLGNDERRLSLSDDGVAFVLARDLVMPPGSTFQYSGGSTNLLAEVLKRATGEPLEVYAERVLFEPLGITNWEWQPTGNVRPSPYAGLRLTGRDLAKIGQFHLDGGVFADRRIISEAWTREAIRSHVTVPADDTTPDFVLEDGYGYQWWSSRFSFPTGVHEVATAIGNGEQRVLVIPHLEMVATFLAGFYDDTENGWTPERILMEAIIPAVER